MEGGISVLLTILLGFAVGLLTGATGIGSGTLLAPLLIVFLHLDPFISVGTDLFVTACTKGAGALMYGRAKSLYREILLPLCVFGIVGAVLATAALFFLKYRIQGESAQPILRHLIGGAILVSAALMLLLGNQRVGTGGITARWYVCLVGAGVSAIATLTGVGTGSLAVPLLSFMRTRRPLPAIIGATLVFGLVIAVIGASVHVFLGDVDYRLALVLLAGALPGVAAGSIIATRASSALRPIIVIMLAITGVRLLV